MCEKHKKVWLNPREAADYLGVSERQVRRWTQQGALPVTKMGLHLRYSPERLDAYVDACSRGGAA